jgi:ABC-type transport system involved in cytochrome c biogenesis permease subunit
LTLSLKLASAAFVSAIILSAAYMNWIDPEIANLQPVLNSYWLMIHVAVVAELWSICTGYDFRICFFVVDTFHQ